MHTPSPILIRNAGINGAPGRDLLVEKGRIARIGAGLDAPNGAGIVDGAGGALLPGLTDHHLHLAALAATRTSLHCGPPWVNSSAQLASRLREAASGRSEEDWIRGVGYHESVAGDLDAAWLDAQVAHCPVRMQHRGGRLWIFNSAALRRLNPSEDAPLESSGGRWTGRLVEGDVWLRAQLSKKEGQGFPDLGPVSRELASYGVTGVTDATPHNGLDALEQFRKEQERGALLQSLTLMGGDELNGVRPWQSTGLAVGARKFHLLESTLPDFDVFCDAIARSHAHGRPIAVHCVTRTELVFALAGLEVAGPLHGDRIEHASVTPPELLARMRELDLIVATQPVFVHQRGDQYLEQVAAEDQPWLYRLRGFLSEGIFLLGSSDAPFGDPDPWQAMQAAVTRRTRGGAVLAGNEAISPEQALALYKPANGQGNRSLGLHSGEAADLCLLHQSWSDVRTNPATASVRITLRGGRQIWPQQ